MFLSLTSKPFSPDLCVGPTGGEERCRISPSFLLDKPGYTKWHSSNTNPLSPTPPHGRLGGLHGLMDLSNPPKGSDWESGPAIVGKIQYSAGQENKNKHLKKGLSNWKSLFFPLFPGIRGKPLVLTRIILCWQDRLSFALR